MDRLRVGVEPRRVRPLAAPDHRHDGSGIAAREKVPVHVEPVIFDGRDLRREQPRRLSAEFLVADDFRQHQQAVPSVDGFAGRFLVVAVTEAAVTARPRVPGIDVETTQIGEERVAPVGARDVTDEQANHRQPPLGPSGIAAGEFGGGVQEIAVVEMVVVQFLVAPEAGRVADERAPVGFVGEEGGFLFAAIGRAHGQEILQGGLEAPFALGGRVLLPELFRDRQQRRPFAELLAEPIRVAGQLRGAGQIGGEALLEPGAIHVRRHR